ncbi:MAG: EamA/RhaT family transporter [Deltaproteobacteria bacterium]|nr:EamA/RhaT family transporter [Deltaproteobacteria bacterium]
MKGMFLIIISAIAFGAIAIFAKTAYSAGSDPISVLFFRFSIASLVMVPWMIARNIPFPRGRTLLGLILMGGIGYVGMSFCYFPSLTMASAGLVAILLYLYPAIVTIFSALLFKESIRGLKVLALILALAGTFLTIGLSGGGQPLGIALAMTAPFIYSAYILAGSKGTKQAGVLMTSTIVILSASVVFGLAVLIQGLNLPRTLVGWGSVVAIALGSTVIAVSTFFAGLERVGPTNASVLSTFEPVTTVILAFLFLGEEIGLMRVVGGFLILVAVILLAKSEFKKLPIEESHVKIG